MSPRIPGLSSDFDRWLASREVRQIRAAGGIEGVPRILAVPAPNVYIREFIDGVALPRAPTPPGEFFDATYPIPQDLTKNKAKVTVRFQSHPGNMAGGVFGCRIVKREATPSAAATLLETLWWAASYVYLGVLQSLEPALYFSMVTYTTLGYGDITLDEQWRLLSAFQAVNGLVIAGWSTALLFALIQKIYLAHHPESRL